jgi:thiol:disulfide interchange protein DsbA
LTRHQVDLSARRFLKVSLRVVAAAAGAGLAGCATRAGDAAPSSAAASDAPEEGFEYRAAARPVPTASGDKLEVVEFFWFGCPHCNAFEPVLRAWYRGQPGDVALRTVHPALAPRWLPQQQLFYALESMGRADALRERVFRAIHVEGRRLDERADIADFVAGLGEDRSRFLAAFDSSDVRERMGRADEHARAFGLEGVPGLAVEGRWLTSPGMAGSYTSALEVVDHLLERERARRARRPAA